MHVPKGFEFKINLVDRKELHPWSFWMSLCSYFKDGFPSYTKYMPTLRNFV